MSLLKEKLELKVEEAEYEAQQALSGFSPLVKWLLLILLLALLPSYFVAKTVSKSIWQARLKNFAVTAKPSFENPEPISVGNISVVMYPDGTAGVAAEILNENAEIAAGKLVYKWRYFSKSGEKVEALNSEALGGETYVLPSTKKFIVVPKIISQEIISKAELVIEKSEWQKRINLPKVLLSVGPVKIDQQVNPLTFTADGTVFNNSPYQVKQVRLSFLVYDSFGRLSAVSQRTENDLTPREQRAFKQLWPNLFLQASRAEIYAETNVLDPNNLILSESQSGSSDLSRPKDEDAWW